ncbi:MAG: biotin attachment protein [Opitutae bacterium]|nr:biotin attachment protein [Opitutae bacterium]MBT6462844.1 biotin attachment protein [Opitutae bacterium]MBT7853066.1 biotin attachment protein [Opitutae bacterium]
MAKKIEVMITAFRDGFQSAYGARVLTPDFMPAVEAARDAGIRHFEAGGGARFQSLFFYCNESAFDMMDTFREKAGPDADLQTLARGINVVALDSQPRDVIDLHAKMFKKHGISTIRNFDALNDVNNLIDSGQSITNHGLRHEVCVTLMALPPGCSGAHDPEFYAKTLDGILDAEIPFESVCFKDASGTAYPSTIHQTIKNARKRLPEGTRISFHTHDTAGTGVICYQAAIDAGADQIDLSLAPCSGGTCQPDVASMWHALRGSEWELDLDIDRVMEAEEVFKDCMSDYFMPPEAKAVEPLIPWSPMPGGALTANTQMMRDNNIMDRYPEVIAAMGEVVRVGGFGTSVTPVSQFYFQQAFNNVMFGKWEKFAEGYGKMVLGYFGKTPVPPDPEVVRLASEKMELPVCEENPLDLNERDPKKGLAPAKAKLEEHGLETTEENIFIAASCGDKGIAYLKGEMKVNGVRKISQEPEAAPAAATGGATVNSFNVTVDGKSHTVTFDGDRATLNGKTYDVSVAEGGTNAPSGAPAPAASGQGTDLPAPMPGVVIRIVKNAGESVTEGEPVIILEAMKMEMEVKSPVAGTVQSLNVSQGDQVTANQSLATIA